MRLTRVVLSLLAAALALDATAAEIAVLKSAEQASWRPTIDAIRRVASSHNVTELDLRGDKAEAERSVAALKGKAALLIAMGPLAAQAAREIAPEIPLVVCMVLDPGKLGIVAAPNVTGVAFSVPVRNQLAAFRMVNPRAVRIGVLYNAENTGRLVQEAQKSSTVVRLAIVEKAVASEKEVPQALRALFGGSEAADALWLPPDPMLLGDETRRFILAEALKAGRPVYSFSSALVPEGALVSDAPDLASTGEMAGELANRLAGAEKGTKIEFAIPRAELVINKKIADRLKIEIPADALKAAAKVY